jgi:eukaryotic translation initiation factor 2C
VAAVKVATPGNAIVTWTWISIVEPRGRYDHGSVLSAMKEMVHKWKDMGIAIPNPPVHSDGARVEIPYGTFNRGPAVVEALEGVFKTFPSSVEFVFVVLPDKDTATYNAVKLVADTRYGFHTVSVVRNNLVKEKGKEQYFANVGLKVNLKAGGINHKLEAGVTLVQNGKTMVVGYDVTHPTNMAGNSNNVPSMVGMVSSIDPHLAQWPGTAWTQASRVEMLDATLESKFEERIALWSHHNGKRMPENIIIYRDGVSEGQFMTVLLQELPQIRRACAKRTKNKIKIALIVSVKRHQTRFYPTDQNNMTRSRNIKNGTVVDRGVTQARVWDFFLTAHTALQGKTMPS